MAKLRQQSIRTRNAFLPTFSDDNRDKAFYKAKGRMHQGHSASANNKTILLDTQEITDTPARANVPGHYIENPSGWLPIASAGSSPMALVETTKLGTEPTLYIVDHLCEFQVPYLINDESDGVLFNNHVYFRFQSIGPDPGLNAALQGNIILEYFNDVDQAWHGLDTEDLAAEPDPIHMSYVLVASSLTTTTFGDYVKALMPGLKNLHFRISCEDITPIGVTLQMKSIETYLPVNLQIQVKYPWQMNYHGSQQYPSLTPLLFRPIIPMQAATPGIPNNIPPIPPIPAIPAIPGIGEYMVQNRTNLNESHLYYHVVFSGGIRFTNNVATIDVTSTLPDSYGIVNLNNYFTLLGTHGSIITFQQTPLTAQPLRGEVHYFVTYTF